MATHKYPAVLPPQAVEYIEHAVAAHRHALVEAYVLVAKYETQRDEMSERLQRERADHEATRAAHKMAERRVGELTQERRVLCDILSTHPATVAGQTLVEALQAIIGAQDNAKPTITRIPNPNICARCGQPLNNVSPGISVVSPGVNICTPCLRPGEIEIARAKGL
jgi:hypothetical protein